MRVLQQEAIRTEEALRKRLKKQGLEKTAFTVNGRHVTVGFP